MIMIDDPYEVSINCVHPGRAARVLAAAFVDDPLMQFTMPKPRRRLPGLQWLFRKGVHLGERSGHVLSTPEAEAVAIWFGPVGTTANIGTQLRSGLLAAPFALGISGLARLRAYNRVCEQLHEQCLNEPHTYLQCVGVHPAARGRGLAAKVIRPMIDRADRQGLPCYLETTNDRTLTYFTRFGFRPVLHERMAYSGGYRLNIWAMLRPPLAQRNKSTSRFSDLAM